MHPAGNIHRQLNCINEHFSDATTQETLYYKELNG